MAMVTVTGPLDESLAADREIMATAHDVLAFGTDRYAISWLGFERLPGAGNHPRTQSDY